MGDSSSIARGVSERKGRLSCEDGIASFTIVQETGPPRLHRHHSRARSCTGHSGSTVSLNSSSSVHKICNHSHSPVTTNPSSKFGRHEFCINLGSSTSSLNVAPSSTSRMVRPGSSSSSGYLSKPNSPVPRRSGLASSAAGTSKCDAHNTQGSDTSDNSSPTSHMSSTSSSSCSKGKGKGGTKNPSFVSVGSAVGGSGWGGGGSGSERRSVHKQNLYVVSFPIILLFNIFRSLLYQLFVLLRYVYCAAVQRRHHYAELQKRRQAEQQQLRQVETSTTIETAVVLLSDNNTTTTTTSTVDCELAQQEQQQQLIMHSGRVPVGPGPADPLLAKQKHHHRRAFEYISKALKIDEENEGKCPKDTLAVVCCLLFVASVSGFALARQLLAVIIVTAGNARTEGFT